MKTGTTCIVMLFCVTAMAQNWDYISMRQFRVKDQDAFKAFVKHAYPFLNKNTRVPVVNRIAATGESGRIYAATFFTTMDQFSTFLKERSTVWEEYSKSPGNLAQSQMTNMESGTDDVLWKLDREMTNIPAGLDVTNLMWRKFFFVTVKPGMMDEFIALRKQIKEADKKIGVDYPVVYLTAVYGAPNNMVLISLPANNALEFYTAAAARTKAREASAENQALWKKFSALGSNAVIDQITMVPY